MYIKMPIEVGGVHGKCICGDLSLSNSNTAHK